MLIFIPVVSKQLQTYLMPAEGKILQKQNQIISTKQAANFSISYCCKLISLVVFVDPIHVNSKEEKQHNAPFAEFNAYMESLIVCHLLNHETPVSTIKCLYGM